MTSSPDETAPLLDIRGLHYRYAGASADALADLDLQVHEGELVAVVGANGSGKSTLARLLGGLEKPTAARLARACGHDLLAPAEAERLHALTQASLAEPQLGTCLLDLRGQGLRVGPFRSHGLNLPEFHVV